MQAAGRAAEVLGVNRQLQEQELLAAEEGQEWDGHNTAAGTGSQALGMSSVSPKGAGEDVEHPMHTNPGCWWQGPCMSGDPEVSKGAR